MRSLIVSKVLPTWHITRFIRLLITSAIFVCFVVQHSPGLASPQPPPDEPSLDQPVSADKTTFAVEYTGCTAQYAGVVNAAYEQQVVELVNAERASLGLPPLKRVTLLDQAARYHAADMYQDNYFSHDSYDRQGGDLVNVCAWSARISNFYSSWNSLGENIARGYPDPQSVMAAWMGSSGHRANIMSSSFREIGVGYYSGNHWVQDFGRRNSVFPIVINYDAAETSNRSVSLYLYGTTNDWTEMRLRNNSLSWTSWMPFQNTLDWQLPDAIGNHTVTVELRKGSATASSNDSIYLTTASSPELGDLPDALIFSYSIAEGRYVPQNWVVTPINVGNETPLTWQVGSTGDWFEASPLSGSTPISITLTPLGSYTQPGTHTGSVTITVTSPAGTTGSPHVIDLTLMVFAGEFKQVFLPSLVRDGP